MISGEDVIEMSGVETLHPGGLDLSRRIGALVELNPSTRVLDVSSGRGLFACVYAREFGCTVTGIDINPEFVSEAQARAGRESVTHLVDFRVGDSRSLPFHDGEFDVVVNECAVGLTAIGDPRRVLQEMGRITRGGGRVVIHESTWQRELPAEERADAAARLGSTPYPIDEWKRMLMDDAECIAETVEDWSGVENLWKMRPGHRWNPGNPSDFLSIREKLALFPKVATRYGLGALLRLRESQVRMNRLLKSGALGYALIIARKW